MSAFVEFPRDALLASIPERLATQVAGREHEPAISMDDQVVTYGELDRTSNSIANALLDARGEGEEPIALLVDQGPLLVATILGVLKAGKTYVPLDPSHPLRHLSAMLDAARTQVIAADPSNRELAEALGPATVLEPEAAVAAARESEPGIAVAPDTAAYVFFTSGTTGRPKGVVDSHRNVLHNVLRYTNSLRIGAHDRLSLLQSAAFSGSVSSLFCALLNGATVCPYDVGRDGIGRRLGDWVIGERVTVYHSVPAIFRSFAADGRRFPSVRIIRLEGDTATALDADVFRGAFDPGCVLVNGLGATETGLTCQFFVHFDTVVEPGNLPLGHATADVVLTLVDDDGAEVPVGTAGELSVRSEYLATGYWKEPALTSARFVSDGDDPAQRHYRTGDMGRRREDGCIEYLGRKDFQLKVRGHRVEPTIVEKELLGHPSVEQVAVTTVEDGHGRARLVAYVVARRTPPTTAELRERLGNVLPGHLVPTAFVYLDALPLGANGKVDRRALPTPDAWRRDRRPTTAAIGEDEQRLAAIWADVLGVDHVEVDEDFFDLGGDSVVAAELLTAIERSFDLPELPAAMLLRAPTVSRLAAVIRDDDLTAGSALAPLQPLGSLPPFFCVPGHRGSPVTFHELALTLGNERPFYGVSVTPQPGHTIESIAARSLEDVERQQLAGPYVVGGHCFGGVVAFEMATQLTARDKDVDLLVVMDCTPADFPGLVTRDVERRFRRYLRRAKLVHHADRIFRHGSRAGSRAVLDILSKAAARSWEGLAAAGRPASRVNSRAVSEYRPTPYAGRTVIVVEAGSHPVYRGDPEAVWRRIVPNATIVEVGGRAGTMFRQPHVERLAACLGAELERVTRAAA